MEPRRGGLREIRSAGCAVRKTTSVWSKCTETPAYGHFRQRLPSLCVSGGRFVTSGQGSDVKQSSVRVLHDRVGCQANAKLAKACIGHPPPDGNRAEISLHPSVDIFVALCHLGPPVSNEDR